MTQIRLQLAALAATAFVLVGCASNAPRLEATDKTSAVTTAALKNSPAATPAAPARAAATIKVGVLLPLTGPGQAGMIADTMKKSIEMALTEARAPHITLVVQDDKGTPEGADAAMKQLASDKVEVVLGPLFARSVQAAAPVARQNNIPLVAFSNDRQVAGQAVSLLSFLPEPEVHQIVAYAASKGKKRQAALIPADSYGRLVETAYRAAAARNGVEIVALETYPPETPAAMLDATRKFRDTLRGIEEHGDPVQALFLPGGEETLTALAPHLKTNGIDTKRMQVLGTGAMDYPNAGRNEALVGAWFPSPDPKGWTDFAQRYARAHGHQPPRIAALAYDAMVLAASLSNGADGARYIPAQLTRASGFEGIDGTFRLASDGTAERSLATLELGPSGARVIAPATASPTAATPRPAAPASTGNGFLSSLPSAFPPVN